jgi:hypothetical protein
MSSLPSIPGPSGPNLRPLHPDGTADRRFEQAMTQSMLLFYYKNMNKLSQSDFEWLRFFDNFLKISLKKRPKAR